VGQDTESKLPNARGLDVHGAEPVSHRFTITDADGNADVEFNLVFPLTHKRHAKLEHLLEEGYSEHEAYVLIAGGEIMAHMQAIQDKKAKR
jgi:hypothetical protein